MRILTVRKVEAGMTLAETMIASTVFGLCVAGLIYFQIFSLRTIELAESKSGASDQARKSFNTMGLDIRSAKIWQVGNATPSTAFTPIPNGTTQRGNAICLNRTINTNNFVVYYFDTNRYELRRRTNSTGSGSLLASSLTNSMYFQAENPRGTVQTDISHKAVISTTMEFSEYQYPLTKIGNGYMFNYYRILLRNTPHAPDGP